MAEYKHIGWVVEEYVTIDGAVVTFPEFGHITDYPTRQSMIEYWDRHCNQHIDASMDDAMQQENLFSALERRGLARCIKVSEEVE